MIDRNFVKFLKEQYPKGTRVRLSSMSDPYAPVEPGTEGSVEMVDDAGQLLMKWDNGRTLALIPGEDSFSVLPPKLTTLKLYMPMTIDRFEDDGWGGTENEPTELSNYEAIRYVDNINAALRREDLPAEAERGLMPSIRIPRHRRSWSIPTTHKASISTTHPSAVWSSSRSMKQTEMSASPTPPLRSAGSVMMRWWTP